MSYVFSFSLCLPELSTAAQYVVVQEEEHYLCLVKLNLIFVCIF